MAILGRTPREVGDVFRSHLVNVLAKTVTAKPLICIVVDADINISFRDKGTPTTATLPTRYGPMELFLGQVCDVVEDEGSGKLRLRTLSYTYTLRPHAMDEPLFRWEYVKFPSDTSDWCRHHLQGLISFDVEDDKQQEHAINLNEWHLPTGWVPIEEVLRFCIVDLGVQPLSNDWNQVLYTSYEQFKTGFSRSE